VRELRSPRDQLLQVSTTSKHSTLDICSATATKAGVRGVDETTIVAHIE
jgi:hypothetical protein